MTTIKDFIERHAVPAYFALTFAVSWSGFILVVGGPRGFPGDPDEFERLLPFAAWAMLAGPSVSGLLLTGLVSGGAGLRELLSRLLKWRVGVRWYAVAVVPGFFLPLAVLFALSQTSSIFAADDKVALLLAGMVAGISIVLEEIGWTGFAVPRLRRRYSILTTGLIVGVLWGAWHILQGLWISGTYSGALPLALFLPLSVLSSIAQLTAYRILLVWVYDRTGSLLVTTLMHAVLTISTVIIFRPLATGASFLANTWVLAAAFWVVVAAVAAAYRRGLSLKTAR
jgi:membrane protease YdiL (CAAX protease family)